MTANRDPGWRVLLGTLGDIIIVLALAIGIILLWVVFTGW